MGVLRDTMGVLGVAMNDSRVAMDSDGMELVLRLHQECPEVVKLVMELHHVSQGGKQGEFQVELVCGLHRVSSGGDQGKFLSGGASA